MSTSADWQDGFDLRFLQPLIEQLPSSITVNKLNSSQTSCSPSFAGHPPMADRLRLEMRYRRKGVVQFWMLLLASQPSAPPDFIWESNVLIGMRLDTLDTLSDWPIAPSSAHSHQSSESCPILDVETVTRSLCLLEEIKSAITADQRAQTKAFPDAQVRNEYDTLETIPGADFRVFNSDGRPSRVSISLPLEVDHFDDVVDRVILNVMLRPFGPANRQRQSSFDVPDSWKSIVGLELEQAEWPSDEMIVAFKGRLETRLARLKERFLIRKSIVSSLALSLGTPLEYNDQDFTTVSFFVNTLDISFIVRIEFSLRFPSKRAPAHIKLESLSHLHKNRVSPHTCELAPMEKNPLDFANLVLQTLSNPTLIERFKQMAIDPAARR